MFENRYDLKSVIRQMTRSKGFKGRITKSKAEEFLTGKKHPPLTWDCIDNYLLGELNPHFHKYAFDSLA